MANKRNPVIYLAALLLVLGGVGYLAWSGLTSDKVYFLNVTEALALPVQEGQETQACRLFGYVAEHDLQRGADGLSVSFILEDTEAPGVLIPVSYTGVIPDTFGPGAEVILEGRIQAGAFTANTMMTKCASKYESHPDGVPADGVHPEGVPI